MKIWNNLNYSVRISKSWFCQPIIELARSIHNRPGLTCRWKICIHKKKVCLILWMYQHVFIYNALFIRTNTLEPLVCISGLFSVQHFTMMLRTKNTLFCYGITRNCTFKLEMCEFSYFQFVSWYFVTHLKSSWKVQKQC